MAELYLSGPERVTVPHGDDVPAEVFAEMSDALAHVALEVTLAHITLPLRDVTGWLWYFADADLPFTFDASLTAHLQHRMADSGVRLNVLSQTPQQQARWPDGVSTTTDLRIVREPTAPQRRDVARLVALARVSRLVRS